MNPAFFSRASLVVSDRLIVVFATLIFLIAPNLQADAPPTNMRIQNTGSDGEGLQTFRLEWDAVSNAAYGVQRSGSLVPSVSWETMDLITPVDSIGHLEIKGRSIPENSVEFFRLLLPQPVISAVEPAIFSPGQAVDFYVLGQCFQSNDVVRINGVDQTGVVFVNPNLLSNPVFTADSSGTYTVQLVRGGVVLSSLEVTCADVASAPELVLQGPPEAPPAAPAKYSDHVGARPAPREAILGRMTGGGTSKDDDCDDESPSALTVAQCDFFATGDKVRICHRTSSARKPYTIIRTGVDGAGSAVEPFSGEVCLQVVDLAVEGRGLDFVWARTYNSRIGRSGSAANGWTFSYNVRLQPLGGDILIHDGTGRADTFKLNTNGVYTCPEFFSDGTLTGGVFRLTFADTGYWEFNPIDATSPDARLARIVDRNGNTISLNYDTLGQLVQIVDDIGRTNTVAYDTAGRVASVTDFSNRIMRYEYDSNGDLVECISPAVTGTPHGNDFPNGKTNRYTYSTGYADSRENHLLTSITDPKGQTTHAFVYQHNQTDLEFLRCIREQCGGPNVALTYKYLPQTPSPTNGFAMTKCIVNDRVGNVTELLFDSRQRCLMLREFTGRAVPGVAVTETSNRPTGKLRADDPDFFETRWKWNDDSLCTLETLPNGAHTEMIFERAYSASVPPRKKGDLRVLRQLACCGGADTDDDGVPDTTERVWRFEYDPRFGSDPSQGAKLIREIEYAKFSAKSRIPKGLGAFPAAKIITDRDSGRSKGFGFITSAIDPRGNVTTASYDATGNCVRAARDNHLQGGVDVITDLRCSYNTHGQLTAITNAADANVRYFWSKIVYGDDPFTASYGKPVQVIEDAASDGLALTTSYEYDLWGNVTRIVDPLGNDCKIHNNALNQRVRVESPTNITSRCATDYFYDANDNLVQTKVELRDETDTKLGDISAFYEYDILDCPIRVTEQIDTTHNAVTEFAYDANRQLALVRSPEAVNGNDPHNVTQFIHDERGLLFHESYAPGSTAQSTAQYDYNMDGNLTRVRDGLEGMPSVTTLEYDGFAGFGSSLLEIQVAARGGKVEIDRGRPPFPANQGRTRHGRIADFSNWGSSSQKIAAGSNENCKSKEVCGNGRVGLRAQGNTPLAGSLRLIESGIRRLDLVSRVTQRIVGGGKSRLLFVVDTSGSINRVSKITDPMGNQTTFTFDANDNLKLVRHFGQTNDVPGTNGNFRLAESRYDYDGLDQLVRSRDAFFNVITQAPIGDGESTTTFAYAPNGACTSVTDDLSRFTQFTYDTAGRLASVIDPKNNAVSYTYDAADNIVGVTSTEHSDLSPAPQEFTVIRGYDKLHRLTRCVDNVGNTNRYAYDSRGNLVSHVTPRLDETFRMYDGLNRCVATTNYVGLDRGITISTSHVEYDSNSRCIASADSNGNVTQYSYDSRNRVVLFGGMDGTARNLVWSPRSNLIGEQDANGTVITNVYDLLDRCVRRDIAPAPGVATTTTFEIFEYDGLSQLVHASNNVSCALFNYDSLGNKEKATQDCLAAAERTFDSVGNCLSLAYRGGTVLTYTYNALNEVTSVSRSAGGLPSATLATFEYEGQGRIGRIARNNGVNTRVTWNGMANPANATGDFGWQQVSSIKHQVAGGGAVIDWRGYSYDRNQNKTLRAQLTPFTGDSGMTTNIFDYDALDRLRLAIKTKGTSAHRNDYTLDGNGNWVNVLVMDNGAAQLQEYTMTNTLPDPADFQMNQYTLTPFASQQFDNNGNLVTRNSTVSQMQYFYDYADRLVGVEQLGGSGLMEPVVSFTYDALGRRISKTTYPPAPLTPVTTQFIHGEICDDNIEVYENGVLKEVFVHVTGLKEEIRENDSVLVSFTGTGQPQYYHCDELGNVLALTGAAPGDVLERYDYEDYGIPRFLNANGSPSLGSDGLPATSSAWGNPFLFHGMSWEPETQLYFEKGWPCRYEGPRFYDARIGRDTTRAMTVNEARPMEPRMTGGGGGAGRNNPWTAMQTGKVKFFNEAKGFGRMMKEEGGRHTPFHNKYRPGSLVRRQYTDRVILMNKQ